MLRKSLRRKDFKGLKSGQQVLKIVSEELTKVMGEENVPLKFKTAGVTVFMTVGLQGSR